MSAVTVRKAMNAYQSMLEAYGNFFRWVSIVLNPEQTIIAEYFKLYWDLMFIYSNVFISCSKLTCPSPYTAVHAFM